MDECGILSSELDNILNHKSGLLGLSKISGDVRALEEATKKNDKDAELALEAFVYRISKYIGSYFVALGGADAISFSGGIGHNSSLIRYRICKNLECVGVFIDENYQIAKAVKAVIVNT